MNFKKLENILNKNTINKIVLLIFIVPFLFSCNNSSDEKYKPINDFSQRILGDRSKDFKFILTNSNSSTDKSTIKCENNNVTIEGTSNIALSYGLYSYLKSIDAAMVNWEGVRINLPEKFSQDTIINLQTPFTYRSYFNVCAFGYTTPWWTWDRWEKEIDWMALHGINMPTAMEGEEAVLANLWKKYGLNDEELKNYFVGPAFLPWQRMGNINSHMGPLPDSWIEKKRKLQIKILNRMHSLGMKPVVPAFNGYVPKVFIEKYPDAKIYKMKPWSDGFEETYWLDPKDPLFSKIAEDFIKIYSELYGKENFYLVDAFNEMLPPVSNDNKFEELKSYGSAIYQSIKNANPNGIWIMQGWLFGDKIDFWTQEAIKSFLSGIPNDKMIIQDFGNDRREVWKNAKAFFGKEWIYGYVHDYGGTNPVFGDLDFYNTQLKEVMSNPNRKNLVGYGVMPEGINNNSIVYEFIYDLAWTKNGLDLNTWLKKYIEDRYGKVSQNSFNAWEQIIDAVYTTKYWTPRWWEEAGTYLINKRPTLGITKFEGYPGDQEKLKKGIKLLLQDSVLYHENNFYNYDLIELSKHYFTIKVDSMLIECVNDYQKNNIKKGDEVFKQIELISNEIDSLISAQPLNTLNHWLSSAWNYGETNTESELYLKNAKTQITIWGGENLHDYASKSWSKMYSEFYWPRWKIFFKNLREAKVSNETFNESKVREKIKNWEIKWTNEKDMFPVKPIKNPIILIKKIFQDI